MPNWCYTNYYAVGPCDQLAKLYDTMLKIQGTQPEDPLPNLVGLDYPMDDLVKELGGDPSTMDCRGRWSDLQRDTDTFDIDTVAVSFDTETAWQELSEWRRFVETKFPGIKLWFCAIEPDNGYYKTNDEIGQYYPDQYILDTPNGSVSFPDLEGLKEAVANYLEGEMPEVNSFEDMQALVMAHDEKCRKQGKEDFMLWVSKFDLTT